MSGACGKGGGEGSAAIRQLVTRGGRFRQRRVVVLAAAAQGEGDGAGGFRGKLQPARGGQRQATTDLPHHAGEVGQAQTFLHRLQDGVGFAGLGIDHPVGVQASAGQAGGEQVGVLHHPQHRTVLTAQDAGDEQGGGRAMLGVRAGAGYLVQRAPRQAGRRQHRVDRRAEWQSGAARAGSRVLYAGDAGAESRDRASSGRAGGAAAGGGLRLGGRGIDRSICSPG